MSIGATNRESRSGGSPAERGRGRKADKPTEIPKPGWKDILYRTFKEMSDDRVTLIAAGVTFYLLLALAPTLAAFVSLYGLFFDPATIQDQLTAFSGILPGGGMEILEDQLTRLADTGGQTLGFAFALSLGLALWSANSGIKTLFEAMNVAYDEREERGFFKLTVVTLTFTVLTLASIIGLIAFNVAFKSVFETSPLGSLPDWVLNLITAAIALGALILFMAALYRFGPSRASPRWAWITPGALVAGLLIVVVSALFTFYMSNFGTYNETYGSLGAVVGFLTWLWLTMIVLIMGAEINSEMEHQTARDTTTGSPRPMGMRGAKMADNVGRTFNELRTDGGSDDRSPGIGDDDSEPEHAAAGKRGEGSLFAGPNAMIGAAFLIGAFGVALAKPRGR